MAYERIDWENEPSVDTPLNEDNLNHMEDGIVQNETDIAGKMDANNPTGTGSFSLNRKSGTTVGNYSFAEGFDTEASGNNSHAEGSFTKASGTDSHAEGEGTKASGMGSHAAGLFTEASGLASHAGGVDTKALANASYAQNRGTIAASENQTAMGMFNIADNHAKYARIVGNGTDNNNRSNAETLDWDGNHWVAGDYTNGNGETLHGAYQAFIDGLPVDSESGNPCVITDAFNTNAKSVKLTLNPIQDLHGYTIPWVGGSGKNLLPYSRSATQTVNGITFTLLNDGSIKVNGTASDTATFLIQWGDPITPMIGKSVILNGCPAISGMRLQWYNNDGQGGAKIDTGSGTGAFTPATVTNADIAIIVLNGYTINNQIVKPMVRLSSVSDATYEPYDNICPISGRTQSKIYRYGKNLFDASSVQRRQANPQRRLEATVRLKVNAGDTFIFSTDYSGLYYALGIYSTIDDTLQEDTGWLGANVPYTFSHSGFLRYASIGMRKADDSEFSDADVANIKNAHIQLERSSTATPYEPFDAQTITRTYGQTVYGAEDHVTGDGTTNKFGYIEYDGSDDEVMSLTGNRVAIQCPSDSITNSSELTITGKLFSNRFVEKTNAETFGGQVGFHFRATGSHEIVLSLGSNGFSTVAEWRTWLSQNPVQVIYGLATPTSIPLTSQNLPLLKGNNVITTDADSIDTEYAADIALYIAKKIAEGVNSTRSLSKGGSSESTEEVKKEETPKESEEVKEETEETKEEVKEEIKEEVKETKEEK